jgi:hypothetical protein
MYILCTCHGIFDVFNGQARCPDDAGRKSFLDQRAHAAGLITSGCVRRRVSEGGIEESRQEFEALLFALETSAPAILESLDNAITDARSLSSVINGLDERGAR